MAKDLLVLVLLLVIAYGVWTVLVLRTRMERRRLKSREEEDRSLERMTDRYLSGEISLEDFDAAVERHQHIERELNR